MYDATTFVFRIVMLPTEIVKCEGRGKEWMEVLKHASSGGQMKTHSLTQKGVIQSFLFLVCICLG